MICLSLPHMTELSRPVLAPCMFIPRVVQVGQKQEKYCHQLGVSMMMFLVPTLPLMEII